MLKPVLWAILAVWVGIAVVIAVSVAATVVTAAVRLVRDRFGVRGTVYCPLQDRMLAVVGVPTSFGDAPFDDVRRCEAFETGELRCAKTCLKVERGSGT